MRRYCPTSEARSLSEAIDSRKFLAVLLKPGVFLELRRTPKQPRRSIFVGCYISFVGTKESRPRRGNDKSKRSSSEVSALEYFPRLTHRQELRRLQSRHGEEPSSVSTKFAQNSKRLRIYNHHSCNCLQSKFEIRKVS